MHKYFLRVSSMVYFKFVAFEMKPKCKFKYVSTLCVTYKVALLMIRRVWHIWTEELWGPLLDCMTYGPNIKVVWIKEKNSQNGKHITSLINENILRHLVDFQDSIAWSGKLVACRYMLSPLDGISLSIRLPKQQAVPLEMTPLKPWGVTNRGFNRLKVVFWT